MDVADVEVYVISFTENGDQLSQWRAYCPTAGGFAIGFRSSSLVKTCIGSCNAFLSRCIYDPSAQRQQLLRVVQAVVGEADRKHAAGLDQERIFIESYKRLGRLLPLVAPVIKHSSFAEEREWRLVLLSPSFQDFSPKFRPGRSTLIPYYEHRLSIERSAIPIEELVVGPTPHPELAREAAQALLATHGLRSAKVRSSVIPYRNW